MGTAASVPLNRIDENNDYTSVGCFGNNGTQINEETKNTLQQNHEIIKMTNGSLNTPTHKNTTTLQNPEIISLSPSSNIINKSNINDKNQQNFIQQSTKEPKIENLESSGLKNEIIPSSSKVDCTTTIPKLESADDGYKWRKYGSKKSKNIHRAYFKCRYPGCNVKKVTELLLNGSGECEKPTYKGKHCHDPPTITRLSVNTNLELRQIISQHTLSNTYNEDQSNAYQPKLIITLPLSANPQEDGQTWRKYGQKTVSFIKSSMIYINFVNQVKGSLHPRSYFKCTVDTCNVKKQIELADSEQICTYEGIHNHSNVLQETQFVS